MNVLQNLVGKATVRAFIAVSLTATVIKLVIDSVIPGDVFMVQFATVVGFYFGTLQGSDSGSA